MSDSVHDEPRFSALEAYLNDLQSRRPPNRQQVLAEHPDLDDELEFLDELDRLALLLHGDADETLPPDPEPVGASLQPASLLTQLESDKYELLEEIGRGGMGVVFKARQKDLDRIVALKMILAGCVASEEQIGRFHTEARAAAKLKHPHIVPIYDVGQIHGQPYFAMQFVPGPSLSRMLRDGPLDAEHAAKIVCRLAEAIAYLHEQGVIHRDLKPDNILFDDKRQPYVTDFGLVKTLTDEESRTTSGAIMGTPSYMSPEQAAGKGKEIGPATDIYSLGALLYECLTGRPPFRGQTTLDTIVQVIEGEPIKPRNLDPQIPRDLERICLRCLEKSPEQRYSSAQALAEDLQHYLREEPIEHQQTSLTQQVHRWSRRQPALAARVLALLLFVTIIELNFRIAGRLTAIGHAWTLIAFGLWMVVSFLCQQMLVRDVRPAVARIAWSGSDVLLMAALVWLNQVLDSPVIIGFPLLVVASGLWFRVGLVWFTTFAAGLAYVLLVVVALVQGNTAVSLHHHVIFVAGLLVMGFVIAYQVRRVKALSRYYEQRPLP